MPEQGLGISIGEVKWEEERDLDAALGEEVRGGLLEIAQGVAEYANSLYAPRIMPRWPGPAYEAVDASEAMGALGGLFFGIADAFLGDFVGELLDFAEEILGDGIYVIARDWGGHLVEFGTVTSPAYAPLRRAVDASGLRFAPLVEG